MNDWTAGYTANIGYTHGYYTELNPDIMKFAFLNAGLKPPNISTACELGFGQGVSINIHSANSDIEWYGTDFIPAQTVFAKSLTSEHSTNLSLFDDAFEDFCKRTDLPNFDFIGLHGIWSWISDSNRRVIVDFLKSKLNTGGVLYVSYNTLPGWAQFAPMRQLMTDHVNKYGPQGAGITSNIDQSLDFASKLFDLKSRFTELNPNLKQRFDSIKDKGRDYLEHEFFNADWHPMYFSDMQGWLSEAKLSFACSANFLDTVDAINLTTDQSTFLTSITDSDFAQLIRDFLVNQQFRKDYWVKGPLKISKLQKITELGNQRVILTVPKSDISMKVVGALGEANLQKNIYHPIIKILEDHTAHSIQEIFKKLEHTEVTFENIVQACVILLGNGAISIAPVAVNKEQEQRAIELNKKILNLAESVSSVQYLGSPNFTGAISMARFNQLFMCACKQGKKLPKELAEFTWEILDKQGQRLVNEGKTLVSPQENLAELTSQAEDFLKNKKPMLDKLQLI